MVVSSLGPGKITFLLKAVDAVELEDNRDGVIHVVQARIARKTLVKFRDQGFVKYTVVLPSSHHNRGSCLPPGTDPGWLLLAHRTQSTVTVAITQGMMLSGAPAHTEPRLVRELSPTRVSSVCSVYRKKPTALGK